jgi:hypothetical protein
MGMAALGLLACSSAPSVSTDNNAAPSEPGAQPIDAGAQPTSVKIGTPVGRELATITVGPEHSVVFREIEPGLIISVERGRLAQGNLEASRLVTPEIARLGALSVWSVLAKGRPAPQALVDAVAAEAPRANEAAELAATCKECTPVDFAAGGAAVGGPSPSSSLAPLTETEQEQFRREWCTGAANEICIPAFDWARAWSPDGSDDFDAVGAVGYTGDLGKEFWVGWLAGCTSSSCDWKVLVDDDIPPGHWQSVYSVFGDTVKNRQGTRLVAFLNDHGGWRNNMAAVRVRWHPWSASPPPAPPPPPPPPCIIRAIAHATSCTNWDGTPATISPCAESCEADWSTAAQVATANLRLYTCLGSQWGCCEYTVDQDFSWCGSNLTGERTPGPAVATPRGNRPTASAKPSTLR